MAKLDTSKIENYAALSAEDKVKALEELEYEDNAGEVARLKTELDKSQKTITNVTKDMMKYKGDLAAKLTDEEKAKAAAEERENELLELRKKVKVTEYEKHYLAMGYDADLATKAAEARADGNDTSLFAIEMQYKDILTKKMKEESMRNTPEPKGGEPGKAKTVKDIMSIKDVEERQKAIAENMALFTE